MSTRMHCPRLGGSQCLPVFRKLVKLKFTLNRVGYELAFTSTTGKVTPTTQTMAIPRFLLIQSGVTRVLGHLLEPEWLIHPWRRQRSLSPFRKSKLLCGHS